MCARPNGIVLHIRAHIEIGGNMLSTSSSYRRKPYVNFLIEKKHLRTRTNRNKNKTRNEWKPLNWIRAECLCGRVRWLPHTLDTFYRFIKKNKTTTVSYWQSFVTIAKILIRKENMVCIVNRRNEIIQQCQMHKELYSWFALQNPWIPWFTSCRGHVYINKCRKFTVNDKCRFQLHSLWLVPWFCSHFETMYSNLYIITLVCTNTYIYRFSA